jgi:hypothetical protein
MKIKELIYQIVMEHQDVELSKFLHDEEISRHKLLNFIQKLEKLANKSLNAYIHYVKTCTEEKLYHMYAYLGFHIMQAEMERAKKQIESLFKDSV